MGDHWTDRVDELESVLAANTRIADLEKAYDAILDDCRIQEKKIAELEAEVERLRKVLESIKHKGDYDRCRCGRKTGIYYITRIASAALEASDESHTD